jgi:hypothetical protein
MRNFMHSKVSGKKHFDGACEAALKVGPGAFMISPGDCDPTEPIRATIDQTLGTNYVWYPVIGNHDAKDKNTMEWLYRWAKVGIPNLVRKGPAGAELTCFAFEAGNSHFVVVNEYFDGKTDAFAKGDMPDVLLAWLEADLAATSQPVRWVIGHRPLKSLPDMDSGRVRHADESVSTNPTVRDRFVQILKKYRVRAYICGHTHNTSVEKVEGIWQADSGHARGAGDSGAPSTFLKFRVSGENAWVDIYRADKDGVEYKLRKTVELN